MIYDLVIGILLILIYIGAVSILFLFSILLLDLHSNFYFMV
jgi:NADH:ubiquinone oxidoreductase subunit 6 (subunit J)